MREQGGSYEMDMEVREREVMWITIEQVRKGERLENLDHRIVVGEASYKERLVKANTTLEEKSAKYKAEFDK